ncbi:hypothetical protein [Agathobaculum sp.]|uniref:hypothetical protein n=1 Tax=Agathobaculum sp. TaxID=2048138 RepID=UPI002A7EC286|nr:hypothetical protein [Agathobaculum sp.]MDY3618091.1 hypothetical protein [Agathobaculum sp.]
MKRLKGLFRRVFALFFCVWIFIASSVVPFASAFVETLAVQQGIELLLTILIGVGGATFRNEIDARAVAEIAWNTLEKSGSPALATLKNQAKWLNDHPEQADNAGFRVSADLWNAISSALSGHLEGGSVVVSPGTSLSISSEADLTDEFKAQFIGLFSGRNVTRVPYTTTYPKYDWTTGEIYVEIADRQVFLIQNDAAIDNPNLSRGSGKYLSTLGATASTQFWIEPIFGGGAVRFEVYYLLDGVKTNTGLVRGWFGYPLTLGGIGSISVPVGGDLTYPTDDFLVKAPDLPSVDLDGNITHPPLDLSPDAYAVPYPVYPGTGDKIESIPFDVPVDVGTGESLDKDIPDNPDVPETPDIPILGDILGLLKQILDALISLLQGIWDAIKGLAQSIIDGIAGIFSWLKGLLQSILDALTGFFDSPSNFRLNFDAFKNVVLTDRFPWSIPWDFVNSIKVFAATASDYQLRIDLDTAYFQIHENIDLTPFALPIAFFRYGATVWFAIGLILRTRSLIKW